MKKTIWAAVSIVGLAAAMTSAQQPAPSTPTNGAAGADSRVIVTGCLKQSTSTPAEPSAQAPAAAPAAPAPAAADNAKFVLTSASLKPASAGDSSPSAPPAAPAAGDSSGQTYKLIANPVALSPHVGKKLELTGTVEKKESAAASPAPAPSQESGAEASAPTLRVESGKIVADTCS